MSSETLQGYGSADTSEIREHYREGDIEAGYYEGIPTSEHAKRVNAAFLDVRYAYANMFNWPSKGCGTDIDRYDHDPGSKFIVSEFVDTDGRQFDCGMRLTPINCVQESLSWSMLEYNPELPPTVDNEYLDELNLLGEKGQLFDLTRFVANLDMINIDRIKRIEAIYELFGAAARASSTDCEYPLWVFTTSASFIKFLEKSDLTPTVLARGLISPDDHEESCFAYISPIETMAAFSPVTKERTRVHVERGYDKVGLIN